MSRRLQLLHSCGHQDFYFSKNLQIIWTFPFLIFPEWIDISRPARATSPSYTDVVEFGKMDHRSNQYRSDQWHSPNTIRAQSERQIFNWQTRDQGNGKLFQKIYEKYFVRSWGPKNRSLSSQVWYNTFNLLRAVAISEKGWTNKNVSSTYHHLLGLTSLFSALLCWCYYCQGQCKKEKKENEFQFSLQNSSLDNSQSQCFFRVLTL